MSTCIWNAEDYARHSRAQQQWAQELIGKLSLGGTEHILDAGCGDGKVSAEISRAVATGSVTGIDSSTAMIRLATERYAAERYPNLSFRVMDARRLAFEERFDIVFSNAALHWIRDHRPVVTGIFSSLRPGGKALLQMGGKGNAAEILSVLDEVRSAPRWQPYFEGFVFPYGFHGTAEYRALLLNAGFGIDRVELIPKDMAHDGKSGLEGWLRSTWLPYTQRVPEQQRDIFIGEVADRYLEKVPPAADGKVHVAMVRLEAEAEKPA